MGIYLEYELLLFHIQEPPQRQPSFSGICVACGGSAGDRLQLKRLSKWRGPSLLSGGALLPEHVVVLLAWTLHFNHLDSFGVHQYTTGICFNWPNVSPKPLSHFHCFLLAV
jgi:hypothetical protein